MKKTSKLKQVSHVLSITIVLISSIFMGYLFADEPVKVLKGPDPDAVYLQLQSSGCKMVHPPQEYIYQKKGEVLIRMGGFITDKSPGNPALPYKIFHITLPPDANPHSLKAEVTDISDKQIREKIRVVPAPPFLRGQERREAPGWEFREWGEGKNIVDGRNTLIYNKDDFYPSEYVRIHSSGQLRKWKVVAVKFYPVRCNPVQNKAMVVEKMDLKITFKRDPAVMRQKKTIELLRDNAFDARAKKLFLNYDRAKNWYNLQRLEHPHPDEPGSPPSVDPNYAVITTEHTFKYSTELENFCFHKQDLGFTVMVVTEHHTRVVSGTPGSYVFTARGEGYEDVVDDEAPHQRPQKIRKWLMDNYLALGIEYVLLIGDPDPDNDAADDHVGDIPMQMVRRHPSVEEPTDLYYSDLTGNWNHDGDDYVGENVPFAGESNLPAGVTGRRRFSVRWEGVVEITGATGSVDVKFSGWTDGQTVIMLDMNGDDIYETEVFSDDTGAHSPNSYYSMITFPGGSGTYPIRVTYRQSSEDAYFRLVTSNNASGVESYLKYESMPDTYDLGLVAHYFDNDALAGPPVVVQNGTMADIQYSNSGDRGIGGVDFYPEIIIGRIPFYDEDTGDGDDLPDCSILDPILQKIKAYDSADIRQETWRRRVLASTPYMFDYDDVPGKETADYEGCEYLRTNIAPLPLWEWFRIHDEDYGVGAEITDGCDIDKTTSAWNDPDDPDDGRGVVMWRTHGSQIGASHVFDEERCADLDNSKPSIVIQATCQNGHPEVEPLGSRICYPLGYSLLKQGAVAAISASRPSAGGTFDPFAIDIANKDNAYLLYFLSKGIFDNIKVGEVLAHVREWDATSSYWPANILLYNLYGDPTVSLFGLRPKSNNDVVFVLDGSGSMLRENKWEAAKDAAAVFYDLMKALRHPAFKDRYNSVVFRWIGMADESTTVPPASPLKDISEPLTITDFDPYAPLSTYYTPIGGGLQMAVDQFNTGSEESFYSNKSILLLSDGKHNYGIEPLSVTIPEEVTVYAVGLGEDDIEPDTIEDIADNSGGSFRISPNPMEIKDFFIQVLCNTSWKLQDIPVSVDTVNIDEDTAAFIVAWDNSFTSVSFELQPPEVGAITPTDSDIEEYPGMTCEYHEAAAGGNHAFYICRGIPRDLMGEWRFINIKEGDDTPVPPGDVLLKVIEDPRTIADFEIENVDHYTGDPIILSAKIFENRKPKTGLSDVYAELIRSPGMAIGTLISQNEPDPGHSISVKVDITPRSHYMAGIMGKLNMKTLLKLDGPRIYLHDDGKNGDSRADDGIYTGVFTDTRYEGSYTFRFMASGKNKDGVNFDRYETLSEFVKFSASPYQSIIKVISAVVNKDDGKLWTTISVTPKDKFGSFLGPFRGDMIKIRCKGGSVTSSCEDKKDGSYLFTLIHSIDEKPLLSISVGDVIVADREKVDRNIYSKEWLYKGWLQFWTWD